jgi:hypothetical protein
MKKIRLKTTDSNREVIVNWDNVTYVRQTANHFGEPYVELHFTDRGYVEVGESLEQIETVLESRE